MTRRNQGDNRGARLIDAWRIPVALVTICSVLSFSGTTLHDALDLTRAGLASGQVWSLVTGHLMHLDVSHAALNVVAFVLVALTFSHDLDTAASQLFVLACGCVAIDAGLWFFHPEVDRYVGLSGLLHAWFAAGVTLWIARGFDRRRDRARVAWGLVLMAGLVAKLGIEASDASFWRDGLAVPVVVAAHRWGAAGGVVAGAALASFRRRA